MELLHLESTAGPSGQSSCCVADESPKSEDKKLPKFCRKTTNFNNNICRTLSSTSMHSVVVYVSVFLLLSSFTPSASAQNELLSARCQAKCLSRFEQNAEDKSISRRQLKHQIISLCKNDVNCSSCAIPCREPHDSAAHCLDVYCKDAPSKLDCYNSCQFMKEIYAEKPGICPKPKLGAEAEECVVSCQRDGDCPQAQKCCVNGCGRSCAMPSAYERDKMLPRPVQIEVTERKRGRSAVVRWQMKPMRAEHKRTYSNLYIVQWKWGVRSTGTGWTRWQTISVRNKHYSILKHLLSPGRYYKFRVAAVNQHGSLGFSGESEPFKLSKDPKAPKQPRNLAAGDRELTGDGTVIQELHWLAPYSDLPIVNYQVSWSLVELDVNSTTDDDWQSDMPASVDEKSVKSQNRRDSEHFDPDRLDLEHGYWSEIIPADRTSVLLKHLERDKTYLVEVHAIVQTENSEMEGDKAVIYVLTSTDSTELIRTLPTELPDHLLPVAYVTTTTTSKPSEATKFPVEPLPTSPSAPMRNTSIEQRQQGQKSKAVINLGNARVHKPYFHNGLLKAQIIWNIMKDSQVADSDLRFKVTWWPTVCLGGTSGPQLAITKPLMAETRVTQYELYDLQFSCHYMANITPIVNGAPTQHNSTIHINFETSSCPETPVEGDVTPTCPTNAPTNVPSPARNLHCSITSTPVIESRIRRKSGSDSGPTVGYRSETGSTRNYTATCVWDAPLMSEGLMVYRVITGQKMRHNFGMSNVEPFPSLDRNTVHIRMHQPEQRTTELHSLQPNTEYVVQVQPISSTGIGPATHRTFRIAPTEGSPVSSSDTADIHYRTRIESDPGYIQQLGSQSSYLEGEGGPHHIINEQVYSKAPCAILRHRCTSMAYLFTFLTVLYSWCRFC